MGSMFNNQTLNAGIFKALARQGYEQATEVQEQVLVPALEGKDLLVSANTGSGKTLAYLIPLLQRLLTLDIPKEGTRALVLSPTRELAKQIYDICHALVAFTQLNAELITGGADFIKQKKIFRKDPDIIIATPGRLAEHIDRGNTKLDELQVLVIDEADRMLEMGFAEDVLNICSLCSTQRQTLLFSATLDHQSIALFGDKLMRNATLINLSSGQSIVSTVSHQYFNCVNFQKKKALSWLLNNYSYSKLIIFCNSKNTANNIFKPLSAKYPACILLHSDLSQEQRNRAMKSFKEMNGSILVCTDVASRGIDVENVELIINYDFPRNSDDFIHRIGRAGRMSLSGEKRGISVSLLCSSELRRFKFVSSKINIICTPCRHPESTALASNSLQKNKVFKKIVRRSSMKSSNKPAKKPLVNDRSLPIKKKQK